MHLNTKELEVYIINNDCNKSNYDDDNKKRSLPQTDFVSNPFKNNYHLFSDLFKMLGVISFKIGDFLCFNHKFYLTFQTMKSIIVMASQWPF